MVSQSFPPAAGGGKALVIAAARETRETKEALGLGLDSGGGETAPSHIPGASPLFASGSFSFWTLERWTFVTLFPPVAQEKGVGTETGKLVLRCGGGGDQEEGLGQFQGAARAPPQLPEEGAGARDPRLSLASSLST